MSKRVYTSVEIEERKAGETMRGSDPKAHLKLRPTRPEEARAAALAEAVFLALALRGAPGHVSLKASTQPRLVH